jgi:hypothetical protein
MGAIFILLRCYKLLITFLILKLTFESVLNECNRLAAEQQSKEEIRWLKSRLLKLRLEYEKGLIDTKTYSKIEAEIIRDIGKVAV